MSETSDVWYQSDLFVCLSTTVLLSISLSATWHHSLIRPRRINYSHQFTTRGQVFPLTLHGDLMYAVIISRQRRSLAVSASFISIATSIAALGAFLRRRPRGRSQACGSEIKKAEVFFPILNSTGSKCKKHMVDIDNQRRSTAPTYLPTCCFTE